MFGDGKGSNDGNENELCSFSGDVGGDCGGCSEKYVCRDKESGCDEDRKGCSDDMHDSKNLERKFLSDGDEGRKGKATFYAF